MKFLSLFCSACLLVTMSSCALVTVPVKVAGKVVTTTVGLAGKAAGAGIDAIKRDKAEKPKQEQESSLGTQAE
ncbi:MAG: hypothetical protein KJO79_02990 [Verrucomicrobiae bacterium]|nr:hypothetical protein [Verrucomicrobiae bacterium]NNJ86121.1 hypothetical protein [Akkermansiaceae bacterium]